MDLFKMLREAQKFQSTLKKAKKEIKKLEIEVEKNGIKVNINGECKVTGISIEDENLLKDKKKLEKNLLSALTEAHKKIQEVTTEKMKELLKGFPINDVGTYFS